MENRTQQAQLRKRKAQLEKTEEKIASLEQRDKAIDEELADEKIFTDVAKYTALTNEKAAIAKELEELYELWEELAQ